jgi:hypothetical protein
MRNNKNQQSKLDPVVYSNIPYPKSMEEINLCRTAKGGFNKATIRYWGLSWTKDVAVQGWKSRLIAKNNGLDIATPAVTPRIELLSDIQRLKTMLSKLEAKIKKLD